MAQRELLCTSHKTTALQPHNALIVKMQGFYWFLWMSMQFVEKEENEEHRKSMDGWIEQIIVTFTQTSA